MAGGSVMEEIDLRLKYLPRKDPSNWHEREKHDLSREPLLESIVEKVKNKERVLVKFLDGHEKRPSAIALIKKVTGEPAVKNQYGETKPSDYTFHLKWDDRKNTTKVRINYAREFVYLSDYDGSTVWYMFDPKEYAEQNAEPVEDRIGNELKVNDAVVFINSRYGSGANIDFGVVREIKHKGVRDSYHKNEYVDTTVIIESIAIDEGDEPLMCKINHPYRSVIKMTDVDLHNEALIRKLIQ